MFRQIRGCALDASGNRPGPELLWDTFDLTVDRLALAIEGNYADLVYDEYRDLAIVLRKISRRLAGRFRLPQGRRPISRPPPATPSPRRA